MEAIDQKIVKELKTLSQPTKVKVLAFIRDLKAGQYSAYSSEKNKDSVSERAEEYISIDQFIAGIKSLPKKLQQDLLNYLNKLQTKVENEGGSDKATDDKPQQKFKSGFGGAKGFFILKEGWDEPLDELFKDYM